MAPSRARFSSRPTSPVGHLITSHSVEHHQYADNTQLFLAMRASTIRTGLSTFEGCTCDVDNDLLLNARRLNFALSSKLGVILDSRLSFDAHVAMVRKTCNYHIWALQQLLPLDVARTLICSIVSSRLDYCNSVLY